MRYQKLLTWLITLSLVAGLVPVQVLGFFATDSATKLDVGVYAGADTELRTPVSQGGSGDAINLQVSFPEALDGLDIESTFIYLVPKDQYDEQYDSGGVYYDGDYYKLPYNTSEEPDEYNTAFTVSAVNTFMGVKLLEDDFMGGGDPLPEENYYFVIELYPTNPVDDVYVYTYVSSDVFTVGSASVREQISFAAGAALTPTASGIGAQTSYDLTFAPTANFSMQSGDTVTVEAGGIDFSAATLSSSDFALAGSVGSFTLTASSALEVTADGGLSLTLENVTNPSQSATVTPSLSVLTATHEGSASLAPVSFGSSVSLSWATATLQASNSLSGQNGVTYTLTLIPDADVTLPEGTVLTMNAAGVDFRTASAVAPAIFSLRNAALGSVGLRFDYDTAISAETGVTLTLTGVTNPAAGGDKDCDLASLSFTVGNTTYQIAARALPPLRIDTVPSGTYLLFSSDDQKAPLFPVLLPGTANGVGTGDASYRGDAGIEYARLMFSMNYVFQLPSDTSLRLSGTADGYTPVSLDEDDVLVIYEKSNIYLDAVEVCRFTAAELATGAAELYPNLLEADDGSNRISTLIVSLHSGANCRYGTGDIYLQFTSEMNYSFHVKFERPYYYFDLAPLPESGWFDANYQAVTVHTNLPASVDISAWSTPYLLNADGSAKFTLPAESVGCVSLDARLYLSCIVRETGTSIDYGVSLYPYGYAPHAEANYIYANADSSDKYLLGRYYQDIRGSMNRYSVPNPDLGTNTNHLPAVYSLQTFDLTLRETGEKKLFLRGGKDMYHSAGEYEPLSGAVNLSQTDTVALNIYDGDTLVYDGVLTEGILDANLDSLSAGDYRGELVLTAAAYSSFGVGPMYLLYSAGVTVSNLTHVTPATDMGGDFAVRAGEPRSVDDPTQVITPAVGETFLLPVIVDKADFPVTYLMDSVTGLSTDVIIGKRRYQNGRSQEDGTLSVAPVTGYHSSDGYFHFPTPKGALYSTGYYSEGDVIYYLEVTPKRSGKIILNFASHDTGGESIRTITQASFTVTVLAPPSGIPSSGWYSSDGTYNFVLSGEDLAGAAAELRAGDVTIPLSLSTQTLGGDSVLVASAAAPAPAGLYTLYINSEPSLDAKGQTTELALAAPVPLMRSEKIANLGIYLGTPNYPVWRVYNDGVADGYAVVDFTFPGNLAGQHHVYYMITVHNGRWFIAGIDEIIRRPFMPTWAHNNIVAIRVKDNPPDEDRDNVYTVSVVVPVKAGEYTDITWQISADWWSEGARKDYSFIYVGEGVSASFTASQWNSLGLSGELNEDQYDKIIEAYCAVQNNGALIAPMLNYNFDTYGLADNNLAASIPELELPGVSQASHADYETYAQRLALYKSLLKKDSPKVYQYIYEKIYKTNYGDNLLFPYYESLAYDSWQSAEEPVVQLLKFGIKDITISPQDIFDFSKDVMAINQSISKKYGSYSCNANNTFDPGNAVKLESAKVLLGRMPNTALLASLLSAGQNGHDAAVKMRARTLAYGLNQLCKGMEAYGGLDSLSIDQALELIKQECLPQNDGTNFGVQESLFSFTEMYQVFVNTHEGRDPYYAIQYYGSYMHIDESTNDRFAAMLLLTYKIYKVNKKNGINYTLLDFLRGTADEDLPPLVLDPCTQTARNPSTEVKSSYDPNNLSINPEATGEEKWVTPGDSMKVTIQFENDASATASARNIYIELPLQQNGFNLSDVWDMDSVELIATSFVDGDGNPRAFPIYSEDAGLLSFCLLGIELPPNDISPEGQGYVTFTVNVREDAAPGAFIKPAADIFFDFNDPVSTDSEEYPAPLRTVAGSPEIGSLTLTKSEARWTIARQYADLQCAALRVVNIGTRKSYLIYADRPGENQEPYTYAALSLPAGNYEATLTVSDILGFEDTMTETFTVEDEGTYDPPASSGSSGAIAKKLGGILPYTLGNGVILLAPTEAETRALLASASGGVITVDGTGVSGAKGFEFEVDPLWFDSSGDLLRFLLPGGYELTISDGMWQPLAIRADGEKITFSFSVADGVVSLDISHGGESLDWYNNQHPLLIGIPGTGDVMENRKTSQIIPRSWRSDWTLYTKVYEAGDYGARSVASQPFADTAGLWMDVATSYMSVREVILGVGDNRFAPDKNVTRAQFITMLMRMLNPGEAEGVQVEPFADVAEDAYYFEAVRQAQAWGIVTGVEETRFAPDAEITRQEMFVMLYRAMVRMNLVEPGSPSQLQGFADASEVSEYAREALSALVAAGIISGVGENRLAPRSTATRAQAAQLLYNVLVRDTTSA